MSDSFDVRLLRCDREVSARWTGLVEVRPVFNAPPPAAWGMLFDLRCGQDETIEFHRAGFVRCSPEDAEDVEKSMVGHVLATTSAYLTHLQRGLFVAPSTQRANHAPGEGYYLPFLSWLADELADS